MARKRNGQLIHTGQNWSARLERGGKLIPLHTNDRDLAKVRLAELIATGGAAAPRRGVETFRESCERIVAIADRNGMVTAGERLSRLRRHAWPTLGALPVTEIRSGQISSVLETAARAGGLSRQSVIHLRNDIAKVFAELVRDGILEFNPGKSERVRTPVVARDRRKRAVLDDAEFLQFEAAPTTATPWGPAKLPGQLRTMAWCSRGFGGMRASDLHAWTWEDIDLEGWQWADVPRPKTEHLADSDGEAAPRERLNFPDQVAAVLEAWWVARGRPTVGAVFPLPQDRSGRRKVPSYARALRAALLAAGVTRLELHESTRTSKPVDFHSFRRAFVTAMAASGANAQTSMRASGHRSMATHQRYNLPEAIDIPASAVPTAEECPNFAAALENWQDSGDCTSGVVHSKSSPGVLEEFQAMGFTALIPSRPHGDLNPDLRRERPESTPRTELEPCQDKTKMSWCGALLALFGDGPE